MIIFEDTFTGEGLYGLGQDIPNAFCRNHNKIMEKVPKAEGSEAYAGIFRVTIKWEPEAKEPKLIRKLWDFLCSGLTYWPK